MAIFFVLVEEMSWFDSHCHLQGFWEKGDLGETLDRAKEMGVRKNDYSWHLQRGLETLQDFGCRIFRTGFFFRRFAPKLR